MWTLPLDKIYLFASIPLIKFQGYFELEILIIVTILG